VKVVRCSLSHLLMRVANSRFPLTPDEFDRTESGRDDDGPALLLLEAKQARRCWACVCVSVCECAWACVCVCVGVVLCDVDDSTLSQASCCVWERMRAARLHHSAVDTQHHQAKPTFVWCCGWGTEAHSRAIASSRGMFTRL